MSIKKELLEDISNLIHEEWVEWAKQIEHEISEDRKQRWQSVYCEYELLSEDMKDKDRKYAEKVIQLLLDKNILEK